MSERPGVRADDPYSGRQQPVTSGERDVLDVASLGLHVLGVLDCRLFNPFDSDERRDYVAGLASVTSRGGDLYTLWFSDVGPDAGGPHPISQEELRVGAPAWSAKIERITSQDSGPVNDPQPDGERSSFPRFAGRSLSRVPDAREERHPFRVGAC